MILRDMSKIIARLYQKKTKKYLKKYTINQIYTRTFNFIYMNRVFKNLFKYCTTFLKENYNAGF